MITEIKTKTDVPNWDKEIILKLTLKELQIIFDAIGDLSPNVIYEKHYDDSPFYNVIPKDNNFALIKIIDEIYKELKTIIDKYNGVLDD